MEQSWLSKNKFILVLVVALGAFAVYAWKTDLSFNKYFNKDAAPGQYVPGQQEPPKPGVLPPVKVAGEADWRKQFEKDRE